MSSPEKHDRWFALSRADVFILRRHWIGLKYATRFAVYAAVVEVANYLGRRALTLTRDQLASSTGLSPRRLTEILRDLETAKLLRVSTHRKPSGEYAPMQVELTGKTAPRYKNAPPGDITSSGPGDTVGSVLCPHSERRTEGPSTKDNAAAPRRGADAPADGDAASSTGKNQERRHGLIF